MPSCRVGHQGKISVLGWAELPASCYAFFDPSLRFLRSDRQRIDVQSYATTHRCGSVASLGSRAAPEHCFLLDYRLRLGSAYWFSRSASLTCEPPHALNGRNSLRVSQWPEQLDFRYRLERLAPRLFARLRSVGRSASCDAPLRFAAVAGLTVYYYLDQMCS